jgi:ribosome maturation factor RimP
MLKTTLEQKIIDICEPVLRDLGLEIIDVIDIGSKRRTVDFFLERLDGAPFSMEDCDVASKAISAQLDVEDIVTDKYDLRVGSAGLDRPLAKPKHFAQFKGKKVNLGNIYPIEYLGKQRRKFSGVIGDCDDTSVDVIMADGIAKIPFSNIKKANLEIDI